jgi:hypothetical protein
MHGERTLAPGHHQARLTARALDAVKLIEFKTQFPIHFHA